MKQSLDTIFSPKTVALIGASRSKDSIGYALLKNLQESFEGDIFPVNPQAEEIEGFTVYEHIRDIPESIDLAVIAVPEEIVETVVEDCIAQQVGGLIIITAGFGETGDEGKEAQKQIAQMALEHDLPMIGPNCLGIINTDSKAKLNATFSRKSPQPGRLSLLSQSGAVGIYSIEYASSVGIGLDKFISLGNKMVVSENEVMAYLSKQTNTKAVLAYLEDFQDGQKLRQETEQLVRKAQKPLIILKAGRSQSGQRAAASHTGALSERDEVVDDIFVQMGILRAESLRELFNFGAYFCRQPAGKGEKLAIITNAGGPAILATDRAELKNLQIPEFSKAFQEKLSPHFPKEASLQNPLDLLGDAQAQDFEQALKTVLESDEVDRILLICTSQKNTDMPAIAKALSAYLKEQTYQKPVVASFANLENQQTIADIFEEADVPNFLFASDAVDALAAGYQFSKINQTRQPSPELSVDPQTAQQIIRKARQNNQTYLLTPDCYQILKAYGFQITKHSLVKSAEEAFEKASEEMKFPLSMSIMASNIVHKTGSGGVKHHIKSTQEAKEAYEQIITKIQTDFSDAEIKGVLMQEMLSGGPEMIMGVQQSDTFGHLLMFGLGGSLVEVLEDVRFGMVPISQEDAKTMIQSIRSREILDGKRGNAPSDIDSLEKGLLRLSQLIEDFPEIKEIDLNPVFALSEGAILADARIILKSN